MSIQAAGDEIRKQVSFSLYGRCCCFSLIYVGGILLFRPEPGYRPASLGPQWWRVESSRGLGRDSKLEENEKIQAKGKGDCLVEEKYRSRGPRRQQDDSQTRAIHRTCQISGGG